MIDIFLMSSLLEAIDDNTRVVLIGDSDQLASVGPGKILRDIIDSEVFALTELQYIFRQSEMSLIPENAYRVICGNKELISDQQGDFFFMKESRSEEVKSMLLDLVTKRLVDYYQFDPVWDIQVLSPVKKGPLGTENLNVLLQEAILGKTKNHLRSFIVGDKVMQTKNDYELDWRDRLSGEKGKGVFNGDIGEVLEVDLHKKELVVVFDRTKETTYNSETLMNLDHAYAMTVHKSQGSEFPCVIVVLGYIPDLLSNRNVLYTAMTRAKKLLIILGSANSLGKMITQVDTFQRNTSLKNRLIRENGLR